MKGQVCSAPLCRFKILLFCRQADFAVHEGLPDDIWEDFWALHGMCTGVGLDGTSSKVQDEVQSFVHCEGLEALAVRRR